MSHKITAFKAQFRQPLLSHNFLLLIPGAEKLLILAESTTYPTIKLGEVAIPHKGGIIYKPTPPQYDGVWHVTIPENNTGDVLRSIMNAQTIYYKSTDVEAAHYGTPTLQPDQLITSPCATGSEMDIVVQVLNTAELPVFQFKLESAWIKGREAVNLQSTSVDQVVKWNLEIKYVSVSEVSYKYPNQLLASLANQPLDIIRETLTKRNYRIIS